jgi:hypothetical protein
MAILAAEAEKLATQANIGIIAKVGNCRMSKKEVEAERDVDDSQKGHVIDIVIKPLIAARTADETFYLYFKPYWFNPNLAADGIDPDDKKLYRKTVHAKGSKSTLLRLLGEEKFEEFAAALEAFDDGPTAEQITELLSELVAGESIGYTLTQSTDFEIGDDGKREYFKTDKRQVANFFHADSIDWWEKQATKKPEEIEIAWEEGSEPLG